ncbi:E3 ubiquitin-protein ligase TRIM65 isoform X1 [Stigmatopora nigra]
MRDMDPQNAHLMCPICLERFLLPVTIPCGHSFCQKCITAHWDMKCKSDIGPYCPLCNKKFASRPVLNRNVSLSHLTEAADSKTGASCKDWGGEEGGPEICDRHHKPLVYYCKRDKMSVCCECAILDCKNHETDLLEAEKKKQKLSLDQKTEDITKLIEETRQSINKLRENMDQAKESTQQTSARLSSKFSGLMETLGERRAAVESAAEAHREAALSEAAVRLAELEENARKLKAGQARIAALHGLSDGELIKESALVEVPRLKKIPCDISPQPQDRLNAVAEVLSRISKLVTEDLDKAVCAVVGQDSEGSPQERRPVLAVVPSPAAPCHPDGEEGIRAYLCRLTFDPDTANGNLVLSRENQRVEHLTSGRRPPEDHPSRFDHTWQVLCSQGFKRGQHYWELEVSKPWAYLGVTYASIPRKEKGRRCMLGMNQVSWSLQLDEKQPGAWHNGRKETPAGSWRRGRVGLLLDYEAGTLTFYGDGHVPLHAFHSAFTQELFPACWLGEGVSVTLCSS